MVLECRWSGDSRIIGVENVPGRRTRRHRREALLRRPWHIASACQDPWSVSQQELTSKPRPQHRIIPAETDA